MVMEIIAGAVGTAFIILVIFLILTLQKYRNVAKEAERLLRSMTDPTRELVENTNELVVDLKKKSEGLDIIFQPLYSLKKRPSNSEKIGDLLNCVGQGIQLFSKIKNEMK